MSRIRFLGAIVAALILSSGVGAVPPNTNSTIYRLNADATYEHGCFDPCLCPLVKLGQVVGTFVMGPAIVGDHLETHQIEEINWSVLSDNTPRRITGAGTYSLTYNGPALLHALELDLSFDGADPVHFFSDFVPVTQNDGSIDIPVSMNGMYCVDTVIRVSASPVPLNEIQRYGLAGGTTYQGGCFGWCACLVEPIRPMIGSFSLVPLVSAGTYVEYAIVQARFRALDPDHVVPPVLLSGFGKYTLIHGFAGPIQLMSLSLSVDGNPPLQFSNPEPEAQPIFPVINAVVNLGDVCYDIVLTIRAKPLKKSTNLSVTAP